MTCRLRHIVLGMRRETEVSGGSESLSQSAEAVDWESEAKRILKAELARAGLTYKGLVKRFEAMGIADNEIAIGNRISRGKFQFTFFLQCMRAIGVSQVDLRDRVRR